MKTYLWMGIAGGIAGVIILLVQFAYTSSEQAIRINDPWVREAPPNAMASAAYMIIENLSSQPKILTSATSEAFKRIEIHQTVNHNGMMKMQPQPQLPIAANDKVTLKPGGYHFMLLDSQKPLRAGDKVNLLLKFADGDEITITAEVRKFTPPQMNHDNH